MLCSVMKAPPAPTETPNNGFPVASETIAADPMTGVNSNPTSERNAAPPTGSFAIASANPNAASLRLMSGSVGNSF